MAEWGIGRSKNEKDESCRWKITGTAQQERVGDPRVDSYFNQEGIKSLRKSQVKTQVRKESKSSQMLDFIYQVLQECDVLQVSENEVLFEARGRESSFISNIHFGNDATIEDKEDLYTVMLLGEMENQTKLVVRSNSQYGKRSKQELAQKEIMKTASGCKSSQETIQEQQSRNSEKLSRILELSNEQRIQWREKINRMNTICNVNVHEGKINTQKLETEYHSTYCQMGLISSNEIKKNTVQLDAIRHNSKITSVKEKTSQPIWEECIQLIMGPQNCLGVELWGECTVQEKPKKQESSKKQPMVVKRLIGQCIVELGSHKKIKRKCYPIFSQSGKETTGSVTLSVEMLELVELRVNGYSEHQKYKLYKSLLAEALRYQISEFIPLSFSTMDSSIEMLCESIASQLKLSEFQVNAARWSYVNSVDNFIESKKELEYGLIILNSRWESDAKRLEPLEMHALLHDIHRFYNDNLQVVKFLLLRYPPRNEKALTKINEHLGMLLKLFRFLKDRKVLSETEDFRRQIICKFKEGVYRWYTRTDERVLDKKNLLTYVQTLDTFCQHTIQFLQMLRKYYPGQNSIVKVDISQVALVAIDPLLAGEVEMCLDKIMRAKDGVSDELIISIFSLDRKMKLLLEEKKYLFNVDFELHLDFHADWFRGFIVMWLNILRNVSVEYVDSVIKVETELQEEIYGDLNITTSALDIAICLFPSYCFYAKMEESLDTVNRIHFLFQIVLVIQETLIRYVQLMGVKISGIVARSRKHEFMLTSEMCLILNNIHFVKEYLEEVPRKLKTETSNTTESPTAGHRTFIALLEEAEECLQHEKNQLLSAILPHFNSQIQKHFKHLNYVQNKPVEDVIADLMEWLVSNFQVSTQLTLVMFNELLDELWQQVLNNINIFMNGKQQLSTIHYEQILRALNILFDFFHNEGQGLSLDVLKNELFMNIQRKLHLEMMNSSDLILNCVRAFADNDNVGKKSYGTLTYSTIYYNDREILETSIMSLKEINNPSYTGKFKPLIDVSIFPKSLNIEVALTNTLKYSENIFINEVLHIPIPKDKIGSVVVKISLHYRDALGIRDQGYSGSIYVKGESVGHSSSNLAHIIKQTENKGSLVARNFTFPSIEGNETINILRKRTDPVAQKFVKELLMEDKKEQALNRYTKNVNSTKKIFPSLLKK